MPISVSELMNRIQDATSDDQAMDTTNALLPSLATEISSMLCESASQALESIYLLVSDLFKFDFLGCLQEALKEDGLLYNLACPILPSSLMHKPERIVYVYVPVYEPPSLN